MAEGRHVIGATSKLLTPDYQALDGIARHRVPTAVVCKGNTEICSCFLALLVYLHFYALQLLVFLIVDYTILVRIPQSPPDLPAKHSSCKSSPVYRFFFFLFFFWPPDNYLDNTESKVVIAILSQFLAYHA